MNPVRTPLLSRRVSVLAIVAIILVDLLLASRVSRLERAEAAAAPAPAPARAADTPCSSPPPGPWLP